MNQTINRNGRPQPAPSRPCHQGLRIILPQVERPRAVANPLPDADQTRARLQAIDQRITQLAHSLETATVTPPPPPPHDRVRFGATVTVQDSAGTESNYRLVGVDETDLDRGSVSWCSPIARALLNGRLGQRVRLQLPGKEEQLEIMRITYEEI